MRKLILKGLPLFSALSQQLNLQLTSATAFPSDAIAKVYRPQT